MNHNQINQSDMDNLQRALQDESLDFNCKGILAYLALEAEGNKSYTAELARVSGSSTNLIKRCFATLENKRYVERIFNGSRRKVMYKYVEQQSVTHN